MSCTTTTGVILIVMFGNIVVRLRFWHAFCVSWLTFLFYVLTVSWITPMPPPVMINSSVMLFSAIIISLIANYQMERDLCSNYLRNLLTEIETIRLEKAKDELEHLSSCDVLTGLANSVIATPSWIRNGRWVFDIERNCPYFFWTLMISRPIMTTMVTRPEISAFRRLPPSSMNASVVLMTYARAMGAKNSSFCCLTLPRKTPYRLLRKSGRVLSWKIFPYVFTSHSPHHYQYRCCQHDTTSWA